VVTLAAALGLFAMMPERAHAQFGGGGFGGFGGFGWGFGFNQVPSPTNFINQATIARMGAVHFGPQQNSVYAGNPNAYFNQSIDNGFVDRYRADRRPPPNDDARYAQASAPAPAPVAVVPTTSVRPQPSLPITSFYKADGKIEWPSDAPFTDALKPKREEFDKASKLVVDEVKKSGVASIATVAEARRTLLDYGRPALQYARSNQTARVADTFHLFLLSLYESLAQATNPVAAASPAAAPAAAPPL
jgi:hypothetical protein